MADQPRLFEPAPLKQLNVRIPTELFEQLRELSFRERLHLAKIVTAALQRYVDSAKQ